MARLLVVDDDPGVRLVVRRRLQQAGHDVREAADGATAMEALAHETPDLIVLDLVMPGLNGLQLLDQIKASPWAHIPTIIITGTITSEAAVRDMGASGLMRKPFTGEQLVSHVDLLLAHAAKRAEGGKDAQPGPRKRRCILVVEDDPDLRQLLQTMLEVEGYETMVASNGEEALEVMRGRRPCAVLLDMMMPVMDGWQFRRRQLEEPRLAKVPVLCMSAVARPEDVEAELGLGCLRKPLDVAAVLREVQVRCETTS